MWFCLASEACAKGNELHFHGGVTSNWTRHLEAEHELKSFSGKNMKTVKQELFCGICFTVCCTPYPV